MIQQARSSKIIYLKIEDINLGENYIILLEKVIKKESYFYNSYFINFRLFNYDILTMKFL